MRRIPEQKELEFCPEAVLEQEKIVIADFLDRMVAHAETAEDKANDMFRQSGQPQFRNSREYWRNIKSGYLWAKNINRQRRR